MQKIVFLCVRQHILFLPMRDWSILLGLFHARSHLNLLLERFPVPLSGFLKDRGNSHPDSWKAQHVPGSLPRLKLRNFFFPSSSDRVKCVSPVKRRPAFRWCSGLTAWVLRHARKAFVLLCFSFPLVCSGQHTKPVSHENPKQVKWPVLHAQKAMQIQLVLFSGHFILANHLLLLLRWRRGNRNSTKTSPEGLQKYYCNPGTRHGGPWGRHWGGETTVFHSPDPVE